MSTTKKKPTCTQPPQYIRWRGWSACPGSSWPPSRCCPRPSNCAPHCLPANNYINQSIIFIKSRPGLEGHIAFISMLTLCFVLRIIHVIFYSNQLITLTLRINIIHGSINTITCHNFENVKFFKRESVVDPKLQGPSSAHLELLLNS